MYIFREFHIKTFRFYLYCICIYIYRDSLIKLKNDIKFFKLIIKYIKQYGEFLHLTEIKNVAIFDCVTFF